MTVQLPPQEPDELLPDEAGLAALYRQLPQNEPSAALDAAVLRAAAQAVASGAQDADHAAPDRRKQPRERGDWVHPKPGSAADSNPPGPVSAAPSFNRKKAGPRWLIALSSAATLVLAAGLAWHMRGMPPTATSPNTAGNQAAIRSPADMASPVAAAAPLPASPPAAQPVVALPAAVQPAEHVSAAAAKSQAARMASTSTAMKLRSATPPPPAVEEASAAAAPVADAGVGSAANPAVENHASKPAAMASTAAVAGNASRTALSVAPMLASPPPPPMPAPMPMSAAAPMPALAAPAIEKSTAANPGDTPAQELGKIRQLFAQGRDDEARQRLVIFHQAHPQWALPAELDARLPRP